MENKYDVRVNRAIYNRIVQPKNFTEKLTVQCAESNMMEITTNSDLYGQSPEVYQYNCSKDTISSLNIRCGYKTLKFDVSQIQYSMDKACYGSIKGGPDLLTQSFDPNNASLPILLDNNLGIASPLNLMTLASDPINMLADTTVKIEGFESQTQVSDTQLDFYNRMFDADELRHSENFLMLPDETNSYNYNNKKGLYSESKKTFLSGLNDTLPANFNYSKMFAYAAGVSQVVVADQSDIQKLKYDKSNSLGLLNRGQKLIDSDPQNIVFSKAVKTPNYVYDSTNQVFIKGAETTDLYTLKYGNNYYPSNITQADFELSGISLVHALFFFDKDNELALNTLYGRAQPIPPVVPPLLPGPAPVNPTEPPGQSLSMSFQFNNIESSIINDITTRQGDNDTIGNISTMTITRRLRSDPGAILKCQLPYEPYLNGQLQKGLQLSIVSANYPCMKNVVVNVNRVGAYIKIQQYTAPKNLTLPTISSHPYVKREQSTEDISKVLLGGKTWAQKGKAQHEMNSKTFSMVPKAMAIWVNTRNQNDIKNRHGSTNRRATITNYQLKIGQQPYLFSERDRKSWFDLCKHNGLKNYEYNGFCENKFVEVYNPKTIQQNGLNIIDNVNIQSMLKTSHTDSYCNGNFIFYSFDDNIPLPLGFNASTDSFNMNFQHKLEMECDDDESTYAEINVVYFYNHQLLCNAEGAVKVVDVPLFFSSEQVLKSIGTVNGHIERDDYTMKASNTGYGSGLFGSTMEKVKSKLPSMHRVREMITGVEPPLKTESSSGGAISSKPKTMRDFFKQ